MSRQTWSSVVLESAVWASHACIMQTFIIGSFQALPHQQLSLLTCLTVAVPRWETALCRQFIKPHYRRRCDFSWTAADSCIAVTNMSISVSAGNVSLGLNRVPGNLFPAQEIYFPGINIPNLRHPYNNHSWITLITSFMNDKYAKCTAHATPVSGGDSKCQKIFNNKHIMSQQGLISQNSDL